MRRFFGALVICSLLSVTACAGRTGNPVMVAQYGDEQKSCEALRFEMSNAQSEIQRLLPQTDKSGQNVALGVAGWFLLVPWFFMDFKNGEAAEYEAYRQRYNHLASIAMTKHCKADYVDLPSVEQMQKEYQAKNAAKGTNADKNIDKAAKAKQRDE